jgi:hypothetical protein
MNITLKIRDESVSALLKKLSDVDIDIIEVYEDSSRKPPYTGIRREGDVVKDTASIARAAVQND